jgi:ATP-dependent 26S proteasome regulatory subunit
MKLTGKPWPLILALAVASALPALGCGGAAEFDKSARYTPESLAQELAFRYNALSPTGKVSTRIRKAQKKNATIESNEEKSETKSKSREATKKDLPKTIDDVLDDIEAKAGLVKGTSRSEVFKAMIEALSRNNSLKEDERQVLAGKLKELGGG